MEENIDSIKETESNEEENLKNAPVNNNVEDKPISKNAPADNTDEVKPNLINNPEKNILNSNNESKTKPAALEILATLEANLSLSPYFISDVAMLSF